MVAGIEKALELRPTSLPWSLRSSNRGKWQNHRDVTARGNKSLKISCSGFLFSLGDDGTNLQNATLHYTKNKHADSFSLLGLGIVEKPSYEPCDRAL